MAAIVFAAILHNDNRTEMALNHADAFLVRGFGRALASLFGDGIRPARGPGSMSDDIIRRPQFLAEHQANRSENELR